MTDTRIAEKEKETRLKRDFANKLLSRLHLLDKASEKDISVILEQCTETLDGDYDVSLKCDYADILYRIAFRDDMSLEKCWQIYRNLSVAFFLTPGLKLRIGSLDELYRLIFLFVKEMTDSGSRPFIPQSDRNNTVVMITSQFLAEGHAPTRRVLDYSYTFQHDLGMEIIIINDGGTHYFNFSELTGQRINNFIEKYNELDVYEYRGERFKFFQVGDYMPNLVVIRELVDTIHKIKPALVYNISGSSLVADLCDDFTTVASLPCAYSLPVSCCTNLLIGRRLEGSALEQVKIQSGKIDRNHLPAGRASIEPYQRAIETRFNYVPADPGVEYTRAQFGIADNDFVACVIGNRLNKELSIDFIRALSEAVIEDESHNNSESDFRTLRIAFVGPNISEKDIFDRLSEEEKKYMDHFVCTGGLPGASAFTKITDLTLNPEREGGGRAAFEGFVFGKPAVSLRVGDAYWAGPREFGVDTWEEYSKRLLKLKNDPLYYAEMSQLALKRAGELSDITATQRKLLVDLDIIKE